jgi:hypothetical protein
MFMDGIVDQLFDQLHAQEQFVAELAAEPEQEPDRKKVAHSIPQRSLAPTPPVEISKPATTPENPPADPTPAPKPPDPADPEPSKAEDEDSAIEERMRLWRKAEKGIDLSNAEARTLYQIGRTALQDRFKRSGGLTKGRRGFVTAASIKANPPGFIGRKAV